MAPWCRVCRLSRRLRPAVVGGALVQMCAGRVAIAPTFVASGRHYVFRLAGEAPLRSSCPAPLTPVPSLAARSRVFPIPAWGPAPDAAIDFREKTKGRLTSGAWQAVLRHATVRASLHTHSR